MLQVAKTKPSMHAPGVVVDGKMLLLAQVLRWRVSAHLVTWPEILHPER